ncbi:glycosyltransferase family 4 protein [Methanosarcina sp. MSH10X1]|uniref:glycosyltransferase family 4 protein n=1 Tax=Methanosarcina sp. MSH10X1 TaxID=2507075 RepID=UPI0013E3562B|nr:glycosyltransferase family 4 protein [Methanosarcina sp. MSH10X1]
MKVLVCASEYYPYGSGIANVAYRVVEQLKSMDIDCSVCSPTGPDIKLGSSKLIRKLGIVGLIYYWYKVTSHFKNNDYDIAWLHNPFILKKNPFGSSLITLNSTYYGKSAQKLHPLHYNLFVSRIEKYCLNKVSSHTIFTAVGYSVLDEMRDSGVTHKIIYIPNGVDTSVFKPAFNKKILRNKFGFPAENIILLSVGRLIKLKQPLKLIQTFERLKSNIKNVTLVVAGDGELLEPLKKYVYTNNIKDVIFLGHIKENLPDLYSCSDFYITASRYEGGGPTLAVAEAMSSGLPCIVSDIPNLRFIADINAGIVLDFNNIEDSANSIADLLLSDSEYYSNNARKFAEKFLNWKAIGTEYQKNFKILVDSNGL